MSAAAVKTKRTEVEAIAIPVNWAALISYCGLNLKHGVLCFSTVAGVPIELLPPTVEKVKFGKDNPLDGPLFVKDSGSTEVTVRVTAKWSGLMLFCRNSFPYGQVGVRIANGEPNEPIGKLTQATIRFDHPETFPEVVRFLKKE